MQFEILENFNFIIPPYLRHHVYELVLIPWNGKIQGKSWYDVNPLCSKDLNSDPKIQRKVFREQLQIASELHKPVIFHNRDADDDVIQVLSEFPDVIGVAHCFSSDLNTAKTFMDMGYYISFSGNLTFKNSHLPGVAKELPLDKLLVETDSPYLSPVPHRGKPNEPGRTRFVAEKLAVIHDVSLAVIAEKTTTNAKNLFEL